MKDTIEKYLEWKGLMGEYHEFYRRWEAGWRPPQECKECKWAPRNWAGNYLTCDQVRFEEGDVPDDFDGANCDKWAHPDFEQRTIDLRMTCDQCPEQYDMYLNDIHLGRVHLRHGCMSVTIAHADGTDHEIFYDEPLGAEGKFVDDSQRKLYLNDIKKAAMDWVRNNERC
jgi:hypothetical protein